MLKSKHSKGLSLSNPDIIFLNNLEPGFIFEESMHYAHNYSSGIWQIPRNELEICMLLTLGEMVGYFGSKLADSNQTPLYKYYPDYYGDNEKCLNIINTNKWDEMEFIMHQQGYDLGEKLFNSYLAEIISKKQIKKFM